MGVALAALITCVAGTDCCGSTTCGSIMRVGVVLGRRNCTWQPISARQATVTSTYVPDRGKRIIGVCSRAAENHTSRIPAAPRWFGRAHAFVRVNPESPAGFVGDHRMPAWRFLLLPVLIRSSLEGLQ